MAPEIRPLAMAVLLGAFDCDPGLTRQRMRRSLHFGALFHYTYPNVPRNQAVHGIVSAAPPVASDD
eukprot:4164605-Prymnesium_polylepis.1